MEYAQFVRGFSERLVGARNAKGLSQPRLAEMAAVSTRALQYWESGERLPRRHEFDRLAAVLGVSAEFLLGQPVEYQVGPSGMELREDEAQILADYRLLDTDRRKSIAEMLRLLRSSSTTKKGSDAAERVVRHAIRQAKGRAKSPPQP
jgi:transcriptional regulator with XRE-family HTH domain